MLAIGFALTASAMFAIGSVMEARAAAAVTDHGGGAAGLMARLVRERLWLGGVLVGGLGYVFHALALWSGSVVLVQVLITTTLLFALPLSAHWGGRVLGARDLGLAVALSVSLAVFVAAGDPSAGLVRMPLAHWIPSFVVIGVVVGALAVTAGATHGRVRAGAFGAAAGTMFGLAAPLTKSTISLLSGGLHRVFTSWELYALVVTGVIAIVLQQMSFQVGEFHAAFPATTVMEPLMGAVLGVAVLDEVVQTSDARLIALIVAVPTMIVTTTLLAMSEANAETTVGEPS
ncbi:MAG: DMT family transporter [Acidimicrobiia bacterium]